MFVMLGPVCSLHLIGFYKVHSGALSSVCSSTCIYKLLLLVDIYWKSLIPCKGWNRTINLPNLFGLDLNLSPYINLENLRLW